MVSIWFSDVEETGFLVLLFKFPPLFSLCRRNSTVSEFIQRFIDPAYRDDNSNTLRILVATDCHLGYMEKDEVRRHDSFQAFEEICSIAEQKKVDFLLLGGDLFHENKPSRTTLVKAIEILRQYCLNDKPVQFQVVSDQTINFANVFGHVNYEDPHFNVGLPVFSIHGNHDDPAGVGSTSVALYGLGNIRDERLNRMFQTPHAVQWMRPEAQENCQVSDWFNILVLHQNRVKTNPKNAINEHFLPRFLDFIVWGHEHECLVDPQEVPGMGFHITQPGSSVATSLIDGESKPKHVLLVEIKGNQYRPTKILLHSVRPFEYKEAGLYIVLKDEPDIDPNDQNSILQHLDNVVSSLIEKGSRRDARNSETILPLVRVKVDYSGFMTINPQKFGQKYVGKVANPQDILIFSKASKRAQGEAKIKDTERLRPEELNQQNIEALVAESQLERVKGRSKSKEDQLFTSSAQSMENMVNRTPGGIGSAVSFSDDEESTQFVGSKSTARGKKGSLQQFKSARDVSEVGKTSRGRGRGRGRGSSSLKQTTLDTAMMFRRSERSASVAASASVQSIAADEENLDSASSDEPVQYGMNELHDSSGRKRGAPRGRGRGSTPAKRGRKSDNSSSSIQQLMMSKDDDDDDDDAV
ncbi:DNA repair protein Mre11 [Cynara cardunculus var. scolymus]|uniref:Double-strand break repair protein n=1 Tax=Cynara cardunculus var. scolymus TaxID=59895 RepID=A0A103Y4A4_CYNCS|nr:DNA repair protein Mre11 [Cynara cardunculus var. scolymus]